MRLVVDVPTAPHAVLLRIETVARPELDVPVAKRRSRARLMIVESEFRRGRSRYPKDLSVRYEAREKPAFKGPPDVPKRDHVARYRYFGQPARTNQAHDLGRIPPNPDSKSEQGEFLFHALRCSTAVMIVTEPTTVGRRTKE